jgi:hypothetical protein
MCSLCRIEADALALCPGCFDRLAADGGLPSTIITYRDFGRQATALGILGLILPFVGPIAGPASVYFARKRLAQQARMGEEAGRLGLYALQVLGVLDAIVGVVALVMVFRR